MAQYLLFFIIPCFLGALGAFLAIKGSLRFQVFFDIPNERSSHSRPTPRGGGVGLWVAAVLITIIAGKAPGLAFLLLMIGALGILEDLFNISPKKRLIVQFILAFVAVMIFSGIKGLTIFNLGLFIFWLLLIVWTTNLYNFMDGIDGIAAITAIVGFSLLGYSAFAMSGDRGVGIICVGIAGASLGFLFFNFPKAKVFMGDVGSVTIGFIFAVIVLVLSRNFLGLVCMSSFLFTFYADELITMIIRIRNRENLLKAHRKHFYQILVNEKGIAHWKVSVGYGLMQLGVGISVLYLTRFGVIITLPVLLAYFTVFVAVNWKVRRGL